MLIMPHIFTDWYFSVLKRNLFCAFFCLFKKVNLSFQG